MAGSGVNKVILIGNLSQDPVVRQLSNGTSVANLSLATTVRWRDKNGGEPKEVTEWHRVVLYRKLAEIAGEYLHKGAKVYIEGSLRTRKWQGKNGSDHYTTEIQTDSMQMLDKRVPSKSAKGDLASSLTVEMDSYLEEEPPPDFEDDIPS